MMTIECIGCPARVEIEWTSNVGEMKERSGYEPIVDASRGVEWIWLCPSCRPIVVVVATALRRVFGETLRHVHMGSIAKLAMREPEQ